MPLPYSILGPVTGSLQSGSFLNLQDTSLFNLAQSQDVWFGFSANDVIEVSVFDPSSEDLLQWGTLKQTKTYSTNSLTVLDYLNNPQVVTYQDLNPTFTLFKNNSILVNPIEDFNELGTTSGSYEVSYVFTRDMAGSPVAPLSIKEVSPSRTEVKLVPSGQADIEYNAFCLKMFPTRDVAPVLINITQKCPYDQIYSVISKLPQYQNGLSFLKFIFFLQDDGSVVTFLKNLYEDFIKYTVLTDIQISAGIDPTRITRIQGIRTYFSNFLLTTLDSITDFNALEKKFGEFINTRLDLKFNQFSKQTGSNYTDARQFCYDFFFIFFYGNSVHPLQQGHQQKYFSFLKNFLNFGSNNYFPILTHDFLDERTNPTDPLTLVIKLPSALPNSIASKDNCWISNFGMAPFVVTTIFQTPTVFQTIKISPANFGATSQFITKQNVNKLYSSDDLAFSTDIDNSITINKNTIALNVDFTNFNNFVVFSSADVRLSIFEGKMITWTTLSSSLNVLNQKLSASLATATVYPYFLTEQTAINQQMTDLINSFDAYESYLFNSGNYTYSIPSASFVSSSFVLDNRTNAQLYDTNNRDSLLANTPEYIINNPDNAEYLTFLSMIGHHFDNIYTYITALPIERQAKNEISSSIPLNTLKEMLISMGWDVDDIINSLNVDNVYLNSLNSQAYDTLSADQRLQIIWNRILVNLPGIYKTKGTENCIQFLMSCYGLPTSLINVREYGGVDFSTDSMPTYKLDEDTFMLRFTGVANPVAPFITGPFPDNIQTTEFKFSIDDSTTYIDNQFVPMFTTRLSSPINNLWSIGVKKVPGLYSGQVIFTIGGVGGTNNYQISSSILPIFNGEIFSVMLRKNDADELFESSSINLAPQKYDLYVQRNEDGRRIFYSTSSAILNYDSNVTSSTPARFLLAGPNTFGGTAYSGLLDKLLLWDVPINDGDFEEHVNDINSYGYSGSNADEHLWIRLGWEFPQNLHDINSVLGNPIAWVDNRSSLYAIPNFYSNPHDFSSPVVPSLYSASAIITAERWFAHYPVSFSTSSNVSINADYFPTAIGQNFTSSFDPTTCTFLSGSAFPFQFDNITYQQDIDASKYGPNKFKNKKIRRVTYEIEARLDADDKSANIVNETISGESNQLGFFIDPQDSKNKDILRYVGRGGIMPLISDPSNLYNDKYYDLINKNFEYADSGNKKTFFNELLTVYKFYFDKSIFQAIKNILPARANIYTGVVIEPTILERPKYQNRPITSSAVATYLLDTSIQPVRNFSATALWANFNTDFTQFTTQSQNTIIPSLPPSYTSIIDLTFLEEPVRTYPDNPFGSDYIPDSLDKIQGGTYGDLEGLTRNWEDAFVSPQPPQFKNSILGSVSRRGPEYEFLVGPDRGVADTTKTYPGLNAGTHSIVYYTLKLWKSYNYYYKSEPYQRTNNPSDNTYVSNSVYLYKYILVDERYMRELIYFTDLVSEPQYNINDVSYTWVPGTYLHRSNTFIGTPDQRVSNVRAVNVDPFNPTNFSLALKAQKSFFEIVQGYPMNHYTHKMTQFSKTSYASQMGTTIQNNILFVKGKNTINSTINTAGINDGTFPVQSFNTSNVNVINAGNVLQYGVGGGGIGVGSVVPSSGGTSTGTGGSSTGISIGSSTPPSTGGGGQGSGGAQNRFLA